MLSIGKRRVGIIGALQMHIQLTNNNPIYASHFKKKCARDVTQLQVYDSFVCEASTFVDSSAEEICICAVINKRAYGVTYSKSTEYTLCLLPYMTICLCYSYARD